jgi:hypothetical protein
MSTSKKSDKKRSKLYAEVREAEAKFWSKPGRSKALAPSGFRNSNNSLFGYREVTQDEQD